MYCWLESVYGIISLASKITRTHCEHEWKEMTSVDPGCSFSAEFKDCHKNSFSQTILPTIIDYHVFLKTCVSEIRYYDTFFLFLKSMNTPQTL